LAGDRDPEATVVEAAQQLAFRAMEQGWEGPPFDPFELAELAGIPIVPRDDLYDARTVPVGRGEQVRIEFNPNRPRARMRYSLAHEVAHTLFPDVAAAARYRSATADVPGDAWQLELLCNIAAGELLMPTGTLPELSDEALDIEHLLDLRKKYEVSAEAMLLRVAKLTPEPVAVFAASRTDGNRLDAAFRLEYARGSRAWAPRIRRGVRLPRPTALDDCTAVGYTSRGREEWPGGLGEVRVQCVGLPPYPGQRLPRVAGVTRPVHADDVHTPGGIAYLRGDATDPRGEGRKLVVHLVNDRTPNWGGAFARKLKSAHPDAQRDFREWATGPGRNLALGRVFVSEVAENLSVATMVAQHGYGPSPKPRIRYTALRECLQQVAAAARHLDATAHMPRIGAGQAGGRWEVIAELIDTELVQQGVSVSVYSLPNEDWPRGQQETLAFSV
jgi:Zn-dependent peptidase ImmA (M78 family)/O-acetyl-ADP-ribose deacetylase (regulator of RNase III)